MEITYRWKTKESAESAMRSIAWNMPHVGMPEITRKGRKVTFSTPYDYTFEQVKHFAPLCGGREAKPRKIRV